MNRRSNIGLLLFFLSLCMLVWGFFDSSLTIWQITAPMWILPAAVVAGFSLAALGAIVGWLGYSIIALVDALVGVKNESR